MVRGGAVKLSTKSQHIMVLGVEPQSLLNFRRALLTELVAAGYRVTVASLPCSEQQRSELLALGVAIASVAFSRAGMNPITDFATFRSLKKLFQKSRPDHIIAYTTKPVIYGALAARSAGVQSFVAMITGLGYSFVDGPELSRKIARRVASALYKISLRHAKIVIFQNPDDRETFQNLKLLHQTTATGLVNGSGVDLQEFRQVPLPVNASLLMIGRLLIDKGIREYAAATRRIRQAFPGIRTMLIGNLDPSPNSVTQAELDQWIADGMDYLGFLQDVRPAIAQTSIVVLPSYREGTPRSVLEGMAMGRAIITTDAPGCRETVVNGKNGLLVRPRDEEALFQAMKNLLEQPLLVAQMGENSRDYAAKKFEAKAVARAVMTLAGLK
jgi:glycosyltransferase involved in cell wall biosynthesis